jgi:hypothetical protein
MESLDTQAVQQKQTSEKELLFLRTKLENYENEINRLRRRESESCGIPSEDAKVPSIYSCLHLFTSMILQSLYSGRTLMTSYLFKKKRKHKN